MEVLTLLAGQLLWWCNESDICDEKVYESAALELNFWLLQRQVEVGTVAEAYFQMPLKLCDNQVDVSFLSTVLGLSCFSEDCDQYKVTFCMQFDTWSTDICISLKLETKFHCENGVVSFIVVTHNLLTVERV